MSSDFKDMALEYHRKPTPGKLSITPTKPLATQRDLALAYSPGVAVACEAIVADPNEAANLTGRGNLVAVISNGTAVLGLGAIGPLAAKPVMEGKAVLFKKFAGIDVFDIELDETDPSKLVDIIAALEPTFGGVNLEDIKAPECFEVERRCRERMKIPVFHDDQHGTAICVGAAVINGLKVVGKDIAQVKLVCTGAGAAALACLDMLVSLGLRKENIWVVDLAGVVYEGRTELMDPYKARYARKTEARSLDEVIEGADIFLGLSGPGVLKPEMVKRMAQRPLILALANPTPEIMPDDAKAVRPDAVIATGRSDFPNQVNNVLCFPFLFRGALDVGATEINETMKKAAVEAIAELARAEVSDVVATAYGSDQPISFGPDYFIPKPFDPRLITYVAPAVAKAAMESGVAARPIADMEAYKESLDRFVYRTGFIMRPLFERARRKLMRLAFAEGEDERVLRAVQIILDDGLAKPILIGRRGVVQKRIERLGLRIKLDTDVRLIDPQSDPAYNLYWSSYHKIMARKGVDPDTAKNAMRTNTTAIAAMMIHLGDADAMICGTYGQYAKHTARVVDVIGLRPGLTTPYALQLLVMPQGTVFMGDTHVAPDPNADELASLTLLAAEEVRRFGLTPKVALVSHSNFGTSDAPSARKMREALRLVHERAPHLEAEGEMKADAALSQAIRDKLYPNCRLKGAANLLIMPNLDAANITQTFLREWGQGLTVGPILLGLKRSAHVVTPSITVRGLVNMAAVAAAHAQSDSQS